MTSLHRATLIIHCGSCRGTAYGVPCPALPCHDGVLYFGARRREAPLVYSQPNGRIALPPPTQEDLARSPAATTIIKSP
jgi:hypothetical protein